MTVKTSRGETYSPKDEIEVLNGLMQNTVHNKEPKNNPNDLIFSIDGLSRSIIDTKIRPFWKGVKRLWLCSRTFRSLFSIKNGTKESIGFDKYVEYSIDDCIIFEKLLGLDTDLHFHLYILPQVQDLPYEVIEPLIDILIECEGFYSRRLFMLDLGYHLSKIEYLSTSHKAQWIKMTIEKLEKAIRTFNICYSKAIAIHMKNYTEIYSYEKAKETVIHKRERLASFAHPFITQSDFYSKIHPDDPYEDIVDVILREKDDKTQAARFLKIWDMTKNRMYLWCERQFYHRYQPYEEIKSDKLSNKIRSHIIKKNREKYNRKI